MNTENTIFMMFIFILGFFLTWASWNIQSKLDKATDCTKVNVKRANQGVMVIGLTFIVSSISFYICMTKCHCSGNGRGYSMDFYAVSSLFLGITLIVLGSIIVGGANDACKAVKGTYANMILITGVFMTVICFGYLLLQHGDKFRTKPVGQFKF